MTDWRDPEMATTRRDVDIAIARAMDEARGPVRVAGAVLEIYFPLAGTRRDVAHGLGVTPTGYVLLLEAGGQVQAIDVTQWSADLAYLVADTAHTRARLYFVSAEVQRA